MNHIYLVCEHNTVKSQTLKMKESLNEVIPEYINRKKLQSNVDFDKASSYSFSSEAITCHF